MTTPCRGGLLKSAFPQRRSPSWRLLSPALHAQTSYQHFDCLVRVATPARVQSARDAATTTTATTTSTSAAPPTATSSQHQHHRRPTAIDRSSSTATGTATVTFRVAYRCPPGCRVAVCGSPDALGGWAPASAVPCVRGADDGWQATVELPVAAAPAAAAAAAAAGYDAAPAPAGYDVVEYKYVVVSADHGGGGGVRWQEGPNLRLALPPSAAGAAVEAVDSFDQRLQMRRTTHAHAQLQAAAPFLGGGGGGGGGGAWELQHASGRNSTSANAAASDVEALRAAFSPASSVNESDGSDGDGGSDDDDDDGRGGLLGSGSHADRCAAAAADGATDAVVAALLGEDCGDCCAWLHDALSGAGV